MSAAPSLPFFVDAYLGDTTHLTTEEHGAYFLLLLAMWRRNGSVPNDDGDLARITGLSEPRWKKIKARLAPLLTIDAESISQKRLLKEWNYVKGIRDKNAKNGAKGGRPKNSEINGLVKANGFVSDKPNESPQPQAQPQTQASYSASQHSSFAAPIDIVNARMPDLLAALGITDETKTPGLLSLSEPIRWVDSGCDVDTDILPTLRGIAARGTQARSWSYCSNAVFEARDRRLEPVPEPRARPVAQPLARDALDEAIEALKNGNHLTDLLRPSDAASEELRTIDASYQRTNR